MKLTLSTLRIPVGWLWGMSLLVVLGVALLTFRSWAPQVQGWVVTQIAAQKKSSSSDEHDHAEGDSHAGHDNANSLELSPQAMGNVGLSKDYLKPIQLETFRRSMTVPAMVVERPGRTRLEVSTPMAGVITHVHAVQGEAIPSGSLLFELRITAEELVETQTALLKTIGDLDVEKREITRLEEITKSGAIPQKTMLERLYAKDKLEVLLASQKEALRLHGLSERQIVEIVEKRRLLSSLQVMAPVPDSHDHEEFHLTDLTTIPVSYRRSGEPAPAIRSNKRDEKEHLPVILQEVFVHKGQTVAAGATLAIVYDLSELYIEGHAFEQDSDLLAKAAAQKWGVTAIFERAGQQVDRAANLELLYSASDVEVESRIQNFYVRLPNKLTRDVPSPNGQSYIEWQYRPGQRLQLQVPVEEWQNQIVLPVEAIAQEGAESYVFQQNGRHFDRVPVHVIYRDSTQVVIKNDGSIFPGDIVAQRGAHQLQMALKNKSGGGVDPHAGHNH